MSYEKKMKDLLARLVSMSPEPPPYPEDIPMAEHKTPTRWSPALVFAGAALVVIALAVPLLLFTGGGEPEVIATTTTTTVPATSTSVPATTTSTVPATTTTEPRSVSVWTGPMFVYQSPENSFLGNPALVPLIVEVIDRRGVLTPEDHFTEALAGIAGTIPDTFGNSIPADVRIQNVSVSETESGLWLVDMNEAFLDGAGGLLADVTMLNQIIYTLTYQGLEDVQILFTVNDEPVVAYGSEGIDLSSPVGRDTFRDDLNLIFLTQALVESGGGYQVSGMANVFEATVSIAVLDGAGEVVHEEFVTATCGSGCWGEFSTTIPAERIVPGESAIRVFTYSPEDGSITDAITIPIPEADVWKLTIGA